MSYLGIMERLRIPTYDNEDYATTGRVRVDEERCKGCGMCAAICPGKAILITRKGESRTARLEEVYPQCMSCNDCAAICERRAITVSVPYDFGFFYKKLHVGDLVPPRAFTG